MDEMVDFPSQVPQKVEFEDLLVQLVKEFCNLILCIFTTVYINFLHIRLTNK